MKAVLQQQLINIHTNDSTCLELVHNFSLTVIKGQPGRRDFVSMSQQRSRGKESFNGLNFNSDVV